MVLWFFALFLSKIENPWKSFDAGRCGADEPVAAAAGRRAELAIQRRAWRPAQRGRCGAAGPRPERSPELPYRRSGISLCWPLFRSSPLRQTRQNRQKFNFKFVFCCIKNYPGATRKRVAQVMLNTRAHSALVITEKTRRADCIEAFFTVMQTIT